VLLLATSSTTYCWLLSTGEGTWNNSSFFSVLALYFVQASVLCVTCSILFLQIQSFFVPENVLIQSVFFSPEFHLIDSVFVPEFNLLHSVFVPDFHLIYIEIHFLHSVFVLVTCLFYQIFVPEIHLINFVFVSEMYLTHPVLWSYYLFQQGIFLDTIVWGDPPFHIQNISFYWNELESGWTRLHAFRKCV